MNIETLERLVIDRASGELSSDVSELLEAYLKSDPSAASHAGELSDTLQLAKNTIVGLSALSTIPLPPPAFDSKVAAFPRQAVSKRQPWRILEMAACLAAGLFAGAYFIRQPTASSTPVVAAAETSPVVAQASVDGFWSVGRLRPKQVALAATADSRLIWRSPVRIPEIKPSLK